MTGDVRSNMDKTPGYRDREQTSSEEPLPQMRETPCQLHVHCPVIDFGDRVIQQMFESCGYLAADRYAFLAGYSELTRYDQADAQLVELCSGQGSLALEMARIFPNCRVTALDLFLPARAMPNGTVSGRPNVKFRVGSAFDLSMFDENSVDMIWGQAALHHLASDPGRLMSEALRVLKPGGRLIFVFEPLGHNWFVAPDRAIRTSRHEFVDESNLFVSQISKMAAGFARCEIQVFNLLAYPMKALSARWRLVNDLVQRADSALFRNFPRLRRYAANCNIVFTKSRIQQDANRDNA